jgi:DNA polymerase-1
MSDILIADGSNLFVRAFFAATDTTLQNAKGQDTTAIYVFLRHLRMLIDKEKPEQCYIIFDFGRDVRKKQLYKNYKANRNVDLSTLSGYDLTIKMNEIESRKRQKNVIIDILKTLPIKLIIVKQIEGDCLIAFTAHYFLNLDKTVTIVSNDKDFYQLLENDKVKIFNPHKKKYITKENVNEYFPVNIPIHSYRLYKAIRGDSSDNIKGLKKFGDKKIQQLFNFATKNNKNFLVSVDDIYSLLEEFPDLKKKFGKYFENEKDNLKLNYKLIDLINMDFSPQSLSIIYSAINSKPSFSKMDFMQLLLKENINTITARVDEFMKPILNMLPKTEN